VVVSDDPLDPIVPTSQGDGAIKIYEGTALMYLLPDGLDSSVSSLPERLNLSDEEMYGTSASYDRAVSLNVDLVGEMIAIEDVPGDDQLQLNLDN